MIAYVIIGVLALVHYTFIYCNKHRMVNPVLSLLVFWLWPIYASYIVYKFGSGRS